MELIYDRALNTHRIEHVRKLRIGVLYGNRSIENKLYIDDAPDSERGIISIEKSFRRLNLDFVMIDTMRADFIGLITGCDVIFNYMHGEYGEDGRIQGLLDYLGKPYIGSGVMVNAVGLNKVIFKRLIGSLAVPTPPFIEWDCAGAIEDNIANVQQHVSGPFMFKPTCGGSSIGISRHETVGELESHVRNVRLQYNEYFVEKYVPGQMITSAIFDFEGVSKALPILEIDSGESFYDEKTKLNKNNDSKTQFVIPARVPDCTAAAIQADSLKMYQYLGCRGFARFDYIVDPKGQHFCLEINTIPGLAEKSNFTTVCKHVGMEYDDILINLLYGATRQ